MVSLQVPRKRQSTLPPVVHSVRQNAKRQLAELLQSLFNNTDDALFEMADRSRNEADAHMYFESMRQIRLHRKQIASEFMVEFYQGFDRVFLADNESGGLELESDDLSLVQQDDLELSVAVAGIASKVTSQFSLPIMQLTKRLDHLAKEATVTERLNPLGPERLSQAFVYATHGLNVEIKVRIILLKLFERFVMECLGPTYEQANALLSKAGVLPDLSKVMRKGAVNRPAAKDAGVTPKPAPAAPPAPGDRATIPGSPGGGLGAGNFGVIQGLLARARGGTASPGPLSGGELLSTPQLVTVLSDVQTEHYAQPLDIESVPPVLDLRQVVVSQRADAGVNQADDDAMNFVGMLFDYILNDRNLAIPMKALIGRLQIPIVKLAIIDKSFFEKSSHPARQLLNALSSAGIGWSSATELKRDALYNKIESIVLRVMNGFQDDPNIFTELLDELRKFTKQDERKRKLVEQRVKDTETGKARTVAAKETVQTFINHKASGLRLPAAVGRFVSDTWSKVLVYACLTEGTGSALWECQTGALDDLLWCLQPLESSQEIVERDAKIGPLLTALDAGMQHLQVAENERNEVIALIRAELNRISASDRAYLEDDATPALDESYEELGEIILTAPHERAQTETVADAEPQYVAEIDALSEGVWVEATRDDGDRIRCKLAAIIEPGDRYVFVNRRGMKVLEKSKLGLAAALRDKRLTILEEAQVFDRALQAVIGNLRTMQRTPQPAAE